jgi:hypothetical protein
VDFIHFEAMKILKSFLFHDCSVGADLKDSEMIPYIWTDLLTLAKAKQVKCYHND